MATGHMLTLAAMRAADNEMKLQREDLSAFIRAEIVRLCALPTDIGEAPAGIDPMVVPVGGYASRVAGRACAQFVAQALAGASVVPATLTVMHDRIAEVVRVAYSVAA
jgi:hypothetical protein